METILYKLKALSDRNRLRIYAALMNYDELCACQIIELLQVTGATASRHLSQLVNAGLIQSRKDGRWVHYSIKESGFNKEVSSGWLKTELSNSDAIQQDKKELAAIITQDREDLCRKQRGEVCCPVKK